MEETSPTTAPAPLDRGLILLAITTLIGGFASMLDSTIVSVAIPALSHALHAPLSTLQWVITGYLLTMMAAIPITGWAVERFGARRTWLFALLLFLAGSVLSGASWSAGSLIVFRLLQGFGGGMILPVAQTIVVQAAGPERIGRIMSLVAVPAQLAPICGPVIGGLIIDGLSRRWMFYVNVPICLLAIVMTFHLHSGRKRRAASQVRRAGPVAALAGPRRRRVRTIPHRGSWIREPSYRWLARRRACAAVRLRRACPPIESRPDD